VNDSEHMEKSLLEDKKGFLGKARNDKPVRLLSQIC
jgi:hypothetical protein